MRRICLAGLYGALAPALIAFGQQTGPASYARLVAEELGVVAQWRLDGDVRDSVGNLPATPAGGSPVYKSGPAGGKAMVLADRRFLTVGPAPALDLPETSIEMWFRPDFSTGLAYNPCLIAKRKGADARFSIHLFQDYSVLAVWNGSQVITFEPVLNKLEKGKWYYLVATGTDKQFSLYLDGNPCLSTGEKGTFNFKAAGLPLQIGSSSPEGQEFFEGAISEVAVYSRVLSPAEIARHMDAMGAKARMPAEKIAAEIARREEAKRKAEEARLQAESKRRTELLDDDTLFDRGASRVYRGQNLGAIRLPVGGIGTGSIQIDGTAARPVWQIFNNYTQAGVPDSFFGVLCNVAGKPPVVRALQTSPVGPFAPVKELTFRGEYPFGWFTFQDPDLPVQVTLETFNPLVPHDPRSSGIPCAIYRLTAHNPTSKPVEVGFLAAQQNAAGYTGQGEIKQRSHAAYGRNVNRLSRLKNGTMIHMTSGAGVDDPGYGDMTLAVDDEYASASTAYDDLGALLKDWAEDGLLATVAESGPSPAGTTLDGALASRCPLKPGESRTVTFVLTWYFPNAANGIGEWGGRGNMYANWWSDALDVAHEVLARLGELTAATRLYHDTLYTSNLPYWMLDRISSQVVVLRSPTCFWTRTGYFGGWEGCNSSAGCCQGNCAHVWHYAQAHARLFPQIARRMRDQEFHFQTSDGGVPHRQPKAIVAFDGQCGAILGAYREYLMSPDRAWLSEQWPAIRLAMEYTITRWDKDEDGVLSGAQWNTLDENLGGSTTWLGSLYLASLGAAEKMAAIEDDDEAVERYHKIRQAGQKNQDRTLFNGKYYIQIPDTQAYRDYNNGCQIDQLLGQWWAHQTDLGYLYPLDHIRTALHSLFVNNFRPSFVGVRQLPRKFVSDRDAGMQMITWPQSDRPRNHMLYADEVMSGFEYSAASEMIYEGLLKEGFAVVRSVADRYDGRLRKDVSAGDCTSWGATGNPFCDDECGKFYARAMSSWSLLLACQGFIYDGPADAIGFKPAYRPEDHCSFFTAAQGYGLFSQHRQEKSQSDRIEVCAGSLKIKTLVFALPDDAGDSRVKLHDGEHEVPFIIERGPGSIRLKLEAPIMLRVGRALIADFAW